MDLIFVLLTQLINTTTFRLEFEDADGNCGLLPRLRPGKTRFAAQNPVLHRLNGSGRAWNFRVLIDGEFTGIEMDPQVVMNCVRVIFSVEGGVLCVKEVHERRVDAFFRLSGEEDGSECSTRKAEEDGNECSTSEAEEEANIRSSAPDSPAGTNNINVNSHLERPIRGRIGNTPPPRPRPPDDNMVPARRSRPIDYEPSSNNVVEKDSFVHIMLLVFALIVFIWLRLF